MIVDGKQVNQNQRNSRIPPINPQNDEPDEAIQGPHVDSLRAQLTPLNASPETNPSPTQDGAESLSNVEDRFHKAQKSNFGHQNFEVSDDFSINNFELLDARSVKLDRVIWWILSGILGAILLTGWLIAGLCIRASLDLAQWIALTVILGFCACLVWMSKFFPERTFATTTWQLKPNGLEIRRGIWWRHRIFIPSGRIQHTDVQQGPIQRQFELATLIVNTGGTHEPSISLSGLSIAKAETLRDRLTVMNRHSIRDIPLQSNQVL